MSTASGSQKKTAGAFKVMDLAQHVLTRPGMYIGSVDSKAQTGFFSDEAHTTLTPTEIQHVPGLLRLLDELLVNAADNKQRELEASRRAITTTDIHLTIGADGRVCVRNNGPALPLAPVAGHPKYADVLTPAVAFGVPLSGTNFDDAEERTTGGANGLGSKLTNIYSLEFEAEICDGRGTTVTFTWSDNMRQKPHEVAVKTRKVAKSARSYTQITFRPDLKRFGLDALPAAFATVARRRLLDLAACAQLRVHFNGELLPVQSFEDYVRALGAVYVVDDVAATKKTKKGDAARAWRVAVLPRPEADDVDVPSHISFVNNIWTPGGGTHVLHAQQHASLLLAEILKKKLQLEVRSHYELRRYLLVVVSAVVVNPKFNGQAKEELDTARSKLGAHAWAPSPKFKKALEECDDLLQFLKAKMERRQTLALNRTAGGKKRTVLVDKLQDARHAGTAKSHECSLVLTEGDSAKTLAVAGIPDSKTYGVFALKGVCLNVRDISQAKAGKNKELQNLVKILGLEWGKAYATAADRRALRYGRVIVMADQDYDGFHITALIFNIFDVLWPELLRTDGFLVRMQTPLLRVPRHDMEFFSMPAYTAWAEAHPDLARAATKYYKGLGTSTATDGKRYFRDQATYLVRMTEAAAAADKLRLLFNQEVDGSTQRKAWLSGISTEVLEEAAQVAVRGAQTHADFVDQQAAQFSLYTLERAIPSAVDGLKPGQRKVLHTALQLRPGQEVKVAQLGPSTAEKTLYAHGEVSLNNTIVNMAQDFTGANNVNLLLPIGQFGSRLQGGKDAAAARYIYTKIHPVARRIFPKADDAVLRMRTEEGQTVEPHAFVGVIPTALLNGCAGIAVGYSSTVPPVNPRTLVRAVRAHIDGTPDAAPPLRPWYRGFLGAVEVAADGKSFTTHGAARWDGGRKVRVTELPVHVAVDKMQELLTKLADQREIASFTESHTDVKIDFEITLPAATAAPPAPAADLTGGGGDVVSVVGAAPGGYAHDLRTAWPALWQKLKLSQKRFLNNMHFMGSDGKVSKMAALAGVLAAWLPQRRELYARRKAHQLAQLARQHAELAERARFIRQVLNDEIDLKQDEPSLLARMDALGYADADTRDKLLRLPLRQLTRTAVDKLEADARAAQEDHDTLQGTPVTALWHADLDALEAELDPAVYAERDAQYLEPAHLPAEEDDDEEEDGEGKGKGKGKGKRAASASSSSAASPKKTRR